MNAKEIVRALETEVLCENCPHNESNCPDDGCYYIMAAALIDKLQALAENGQSAIDTNMRLVKVVESLQAQLAKYDKVAAEYGIDGKTMLTLAKSQTRTARDNVELQEQLATALEEAKRQHYLAFEMAGKADEYMRRAQDARNELCLKCGRYHEAHNGSCDGCRWKE